MVVQQLFEGIITVMLVKFILNDVPHAAGTYGPGSGWVHDPSLVVTEATVGEAVDALGRPIDKLIRRAVVDFNAAGFTTSGSCEGHIEDGVPLPYVDAEFRTTTEYNDKHPKLQALADEFNRKYNIHPSVQINLTVVTGHGEKGFIRIQTLSDETQRNIEEMYKEVHYYPSWYSPPKEYKRKSLGVMNRFAAYVRARLSI